MSNWNCRRFSAPIALAAAALLSAASGAQQVERSAPAAPDHSTDLAFDPTFIEQPIMAPPADASTVAPPRALRAGPPPGGSCQSIGAIITSPFGTPALTAAFGTAVNSTHFYDNFRTPSSGGAIPVSKLRFTTIQRVGTGSATTAPFSQGPAITSFSVAIFPDAGGFPASTAVVGPTTVTGATLTATANTAYAVGSGNATGVNPANITGFDYEAALPAGSTLQPDRCYWVRISHTATPANTTVFYATSPDGDGMFWQRTSANPTPTTGAVPNFGDIHFCLDIPTLSVGDGVTCPLATTMTCYVPTASPNPQPAGNMNCQVYDINGVGTGSSVVLNVFTADNFRVATASTLRGGCFQGFYGGSATIPTIAEDAFRIRIMRDSAIFPGVPDTSSPLLEITVGAGGSGGTLSRVSAGVFTARGQSWTWTLDTPLPLPAGNYWYEVAYANPNWFDAWNWYLKSNDRPLTIADSFRQSKGAATIDYGRNTQSFTIDQSWCLTLTGNETLSKPTNRNASVNNQCADATPLAIGSTVFGNNIDGLVSAIIPPSCGEIYSNNTGVWFTIVGNGETLTLTTCASGSEPNVPNTTFDTQLSVYCSQSQTANPCDGPLACVASNNDDPDCTTPGPTRATVSFPSQSGKTYHIYLTDRRTPNGGAAANGYYYLTATSSGTPATSVPCASIAPCRIDIPAGAVAEEESCDNATSNNGTCNGAVGINAGQWGTGAVYNSGTAREVDVFKVLNLPTSPGGQWVKITVRAEIPVIVRYGNGPCTTGGPLQQYWFTAGGCTAPDTFNVFQQNEGDLYVVIAAASFSGSPCTNPAGVGNRYVVKVEAATLGACCSAFNVCATLPRDGVPAVGVFTAGAPPIPFNAVPCAAYGFNTGHYLGDGTACNPSDPNNSNNPCEPDGNPPAAATLGRCCQPDGSCSLAAQAAGGPPPQTCANGVFTAGETCSASACPVSIRACCSPGGACTIVPPAVCVGTVGTATTCLPDVCPQPPNGSCCNGTTCTLTFTAADVTACSSGGGTPNAATSCTPTPCVASTVTCCRGATCQTNIAAASCTGVIAGSNATPVATCTGNTFAGCCFGDYDHNNTKDITDIFTFLNAWFSASTYADITSNGASTPDITDIFTFLNAWFGTCS